MSWVKSSDVAEALGGVSASDEAYLDRCTDAANDFAFRRRVQAGYKDNPTVSPGASASMGVITYAVALFRERGAVDSFASFEDFGAGVVPQSSFGQVLRLLGIPRPAIDRAPTLDDMYVDRMRRGYPGIRR